MGRKKDYEQRRTEPRAKVTKISRSKKGRRAQIAALAVQYPKNVRRPKTRGDCVDRPRPCPFVSCKHHLYLDVMENGNLKINFPHLEVDELNESCVLDVAERDGMTLHETGEIINVTRERVRQIEVKALIDLRRKLRED